jgi:hypothetical protein
VACSNAQVHGDDCIPALLTEHVTSQEQINTKFAFLLFLTCFLPQNISEQKTCIEMAINTMIAPGVKRGREVVVPGCSSPPYKLKRNKTQIL